MKSLYTWLSDRDGYVVAAVSAILGVAVSFGWEVSAEQTVGITGAVGALLALILGRPVKPVE